MPKPKRRFLQLNSIDQNNMSASSQSSIPLKLQRCFVCYNEFTPFKLSTDKWESNMIKMFYSALNLPSPDDGGDDEDEDPVISLPFCPQCHSKISVMASLHGQLQLIQAQFSNIRNDVVFAIVETNEKNCRNGPMDFIRQQIYDKWKERYDEAKTKGYLDNPIGLESIASESSASSKRVSEEFLYPNSENNNLLDEFTNSLGVPVSPFGGVAPPNRRFPTKLVNNTSQQRKPTGREIPSSIEEQPLLSKRPPRAAALSNFFMYNESTSMAKFREMEAMVKSMGSSPPMPKLIPMGMQGQSGKRDVHQQLVTSGELTTESTKPNESIGLKSGKVKVNRSPRGNVASPSKPPISGFQQRGMPAKRSPSVSNDVEKIPLKVPRMRAGSKRRVQVPAKIKFQMGKKSRQFGFKKLLNSATENRPNESMDDTDFANGDNVLATTQNDMAESAPDNSESGEAGENSGNFACRLCPKIYYNNSRLRRHESLCHPSMKALQCTLCSNGFSSRLAFRRHMQHQHNQPLTEFTAITCAICRQEFDKQSTFDAHMTTHEETFRSGNPSSSTLDSPGTVSGRRTKSKPGRRAKDTKESPQFKVEATSTSPLVEKSTASPDVTCPENIKTAEPVSTDSANEHLELVVPQKKSSSKKKKPFTGLRKRRRRRIPKGEEIKKEPDVARVIIPRKKVQPSSGPVRKSLRRAEVNTNPDTNKSPSKSESGNTKTVDSPVVQRSNSKSNPEKASAVDESDTGSTRKGRSSGINKNAASTAQPASIQSNEEVQSKNVVDDHEKISTNISQTTPTKVKKDKPSTRKESSNGLASPRGRLVCPICDLEYPFIGLLNMHLKSHPRDETRCNDCRVHLKTIEEYREHIVTAHNRQLLSCSFCDEKFGNKNHLMGHEIAHKYERSRGKTEKPAMSSTSVASNNSDEPKGEDSKNSSSSKKQGTTGGVSDVVITNESELSTSNTKTTEGSAGLSKNLASTKSTKVDDIDSPAPSKTKLDAAPSDSASNEVITTNTNDVVKEVEKNSTDSAGLKFSENTAGNNAVSEPKTPIKDSQVNEKKICG